MSKRRHYQPITDQANRPNTRSNYKRILEQAAQAGILTGTPGTVSEITILHDDWCAIYQGEPCNCDPDIIQHPGR